MKQDLGIAGRLAHTFLNSKLTPLFIAASLALGVFRGRDHSSRRRAADPGSNAGHYDRHAGCISVPRWKSA